MGTPVVLGFDVGGTRTKAALVEPLSGWVRRDMVFPTPGGGLSAFVERLQVVAGELLTESGSTRADLAGCGVGLPGFVAGREVSRLWESLAFLEGIGLGGTLEAALGVPAVIDNDARCVALAEARFGGHGGDRLLSLTLGSGLGVALTTGGNLQERTCATHLAGHFPLRPGPWTCFCGIPGCLEPFVSAAALGADPAAAMAGDAAGEPLRTWLADLALGLNAFIHIYAPDVIVLGGGLARGLAPHAAALEESLFARPFNGYTALLRLSRLAERAGPLGAAALAAPTPLP